MDEQQPMSNNNSAVTRDKSDPLRLMTTKQAVTFLTLCLTFHLAYVLGGGNWLLPVTVESSQTRKIAVIIGHTDILCRRKEREKKKSISIMHGSNKSRRQVILST
jgi:hypothetical protein